MPPGTPRGAAPARARATVLLRPLRHAHHGRGGHATPPRRARRHRAATRRRPSGAQRERRRTSSSSSSPRRRVTATASPSIATTTAESALPRSRRAPPHCHRRTHQSRAITLSMPPLQLARHVATRYVQPLREGGSLPAVVDTEAGGLLVVKFRGAGQGAKVLVAELIVGLLAQSLEPADSRARARRRQRPLRPKRAGSRDPGAPPAKPRHQRRRALPRGCVQLRRRRRRRPPRPRARGAHRLARRVHDEPRSHPPQPEPARLAATPLAHRPRRRAVRASRLELGRRGAHRHELSAHQVARPARRGGRSRRGRRGVRGADHAERDRRGRRGRARRAVPRQRRRPAGVRRPRPKRASGIAPTSRAG